MKTIARKISFLLITTSLIFGTVSCSSDDNNNTTENTENNNNENNNPETETHEVEYKITIQEPIITGISYTDANGQTTTVTDSFEGMTTWSKAIEVEAPFDAEVNLEFSSPGGFSRQYKLEIYVDGQLKRVDNSSASGEVSVSLGYGFN